MLVGLVGVVGCACVASAQINSSGTSQRTSEIAKVQLPKDVYPDSLARLPLVKREEMDEYGKQVYDTVARSNPRYKDGVPGPVGMWMYSPRLAEHLIPIRNYIRTETPLGQRLVELAILVTARETDNQFEWAAHETIARNEGLESEIIEIIKYRQEPSNLGEKEALIIRFGRELVGERKVHSETFADLLKVFGKQGLMDLQATMSLYNFMNETIITFDAHRERDREYPILPPLP